MAALKRRTGDLAASEKILLRIFQQPRRSSYPKSLEAYPISLMASVLEDSGRGEEAATWYEKLFDIGVKSCGIQSTQALSSCENWEFCYVELRSFGKAISIFEKVIQDIELGQGRGPESSDQCLQRLRGFIAEVMEMQEEEEAWEVDEMSHDQCMSEDEEMPHDEEMPGGEEMLNNDDDIIEDIDLYGA